MQYNMDKLEQKFIYLLFEIDSGLLLTHFFNFQMFQYHYHFFLLSAAGGVRAIVHLPPRKKTRFNSGT